MRPALRLEPRIIKPDVAFNSLVQWLHQDVIVNRKAPGLLVGLSGTDSIVTFMAAYEALKLAGKPDRMMGVHFAPSETLLQGDPDAHMSLWFSQEVAPWLKERAPQAKIVIDTSIDWRCDGLRWGALADMSAVYFDRRSRIMRPSDQKYWVLGTRNRSEDISLNYSNASMMASIQPIVNLWKSEILQITKYLGAPQIAISKSCEMDCVCGRERFVAEHIPEIDLILMDKVGELPSTYPQSHIKPELFNKLTAFVEAKATHNQFKLHIPYRPEHTTYESYLDDPVVVAFEHGSLDLRTFNHRQHLYVAWCYLQHLPEEVSTNRYCLHLLTILNKAGVMAKFNYEKTNKYMHTLAAAMTANPGLRFGDLLDKCPGLLQK